MTDGPAHSGSALLTAGAVLGVLAGGVTLVDQLIEVKPKVASALNPAAEQVLREEQRADSLGRLTRERAMQDVIWLDSVAAELPSSHNYRVVLLNSCPTDAYVALLYQMVDYHHLGAVTTGWWYVPSWGTDTVSIPAAGRRIGYHVDFVDEKAWDFEGSGVRQATFVNVPLEADSNRAITLLMKSVGCLALFDHLRSLRSLDSTRVPFWSPTK